MTGLDEVVLERLRTEGDQPESLFAEERRCAYPPCSKPLQPRAGEKPAHFRLRTCCDASCANRHAKGSTVPVDLPDRHCAECGTVLRRRGGESPSRFSRRRFCSRPCAARNTIRNAPAYQRPEPVAESKPCARCTGVVVRRVGEARHKFHTRKYCSSECRYQAPPQRVDGPVETKRCACCGGVFERSPRRLWPAKKWAARKFCSAGCASRSRVRPVVAPSVVARPVADRVVSGPVWRPAGWSKVPNTWAGHRPPSDDEVAS